MTRSTAWAGRARRDYGSRGYPDETLADLSSALRAVRPGLLDFVWLATREAGVSRSEAESRCVAVAYSAAAVNLADDLADGDCDYLDEPYKSGPTTQYLLQSLFFQKLCELGMPSVVISAVTRHFERAAAAQHVELTTTAWTTARARQVAEGITGHQLAAYLRVGLHGTPRSEQAEEVGVDVGFAAHVALDADSRDDRFWSLEPSERVTLANDAIDAIERAAALGLAAARPVAAEVHRSLDAIAHAPR